MSRSAMFGGSILSFCILHSCQEVDIYIQLLVFIITMGLWDVLSFKIATLFFYPHFCDFEIDLM